MSRFRYCSYARERVDMPAAAVEREHLLHAKSFAPRFSLYVLVDRFEHLDVARAFEQRNVPQLDDRHAQVAEANARGCEERKGREVVERLARPTRECLVEHRDGVIGLAIAHVLLAEGQRRPRQREVQFVGADLEPVAARR